MAIAYTPGEPAGVGPDLIIQLAQGHHLPEELVVVADPDALLERAALLKLPLSVQPFDLQNLVPAGSQSLTVLPIRLRTPVVAGTLDVANAAYVLEALDVTVQACLDGIFSGMVTGPIHKGIINDSGVPFTGHTDYLAQKTQTETVVMMLASDLMRVALVTTHIPLKEVPQAITPEHLIKTIDIILKAFPDKPRITVCGLNPHAGEGGYLGREEIDIIVPIIEQFQSLGHHLKGPIPADTAFIPSIREQTDIYVAMYHDQGLPVIKALGFGGIANVTLGLPFTRTSVDHGTALDLAGTGIAKTDSLIYAITSLLSSKRLY